MPVYRYKAYCADGARTSGSLSASTEQQALQELQKRGLRPFGIRKTSLSDQREFKPITLLPVKELDLGRLFSELDALLSADLRIDEALRTIVLETRSARNRAPLAHIHQAMSEGQSLSVAFSSLTHLQPAALAILESAETSGRIHQAVATIATDYRMRAKNREAIVSAVAYPAFLVIAMIAAFLVILFSLVPAIAPVFEGSAAPPSGVVSFLIFLHHLLSENTLAVLLALTLCGIAAVCTLVSNRLRRASIKMLLRMPLAGPLLSDRGLSEYMRSLATLLANGVPMRKALQLSVQACSLPAFHPILLEIRDRVVSGQSFKTAADASRLFDPTTIAIIGMGDEASRLPDALERAANLLSTRAERRSTRTLSLISPILTIVMGLAVGGLVLSIMSALMDMNDMAFQ